MVQDDVTHIVTQIIREELQADALVLVPGSELSETEGWDSVTGSCIMIAIENRFGFEFHGAVLDHLTTLQSLVSLIESNRAASAAGA